ncbi:RNA polymerase sigma factor [Gaetbulibacter saemankumensis]|uniref:RNA polymerase sigma factor n=1 Tax=Gaetbulibacter saemankumensis TaxID=311208 RepID=UPI000420957B|nr:RNA polymerase sigma-70 factor [Gaetbulibacter saemankumensis]
MSLNFENLIHNLKEGDSQAYKVLFDTFYESLYAFAFHYVKDHYAAEEIVVNIMLTIWEKRRTLDPNKNIKSYLYTSVKNASFDYLKKRNKTTSLNLETKDLTFTNFEQRIIKEETHRLILQALESLPKKCRQVFEMCCIENLKYKEVAETLNISINTVKSQRARAIEILKMQLKEEHLFLFILNNITIKN